MENYLFKNASNEKINHGVIAKNIVFHYGKARTDVRCNASSQQRSIPYLPSNLGTADIIWVDCHASLLYSPNLVPSYYRLFPKLKEQLSGPCFVPCNEVKENEEKENDNSISQRVGGRILGQGDTKVAALFGKMLLHNVITM